MTSLNLPIIDTQRQVAKVKEVEVVLALAPWPSGSRGSPETRST